MSNRVPSAQRPSGSADAGVIINIDACANTPKNPVVEFLTAGTYEVQFIGKGKGGLYDAWSRWNFIIGCDDKGENCTTGWLNEYCISSNEFTINVPTTGVFATPEQALAKAQNASFTLSSSSNVNFFIGDDRVEDNQGGVSLRVKKVSQPTSSSSPSPLLATLAWLVILVGSAIVSWYIFDP
ncbi:MAG TPA: hypothetical protein DCY91_30895 [Cyanobacteria bacterium UBA11370]|nr:hypothetical protein [Cyanobacteria bacterium UBA11370]HBY79588.1 hypothetical protein [Cyanobacteria bacterium UBA11148]